MPFSCTPIPTSPNSFARPTRQCFHADSSSHAAERPDHTAAAGKDKKLVYFLLNSPPKRRPNRETEKTEPFWGSLLNSWWTGSNETKAQQADSREQSNLFVATGKNEFVAKFEAFKMGIES